MNRPGFSGDSLNQDFHFGPGKGIVKLRPTAVFDTQHGGFTAGSSQYLGGDRLAIRQLDNTAKRARQ